MAGGVVLPHDMNDVAVTINALMPEATQIARPKKLKREDGQIPRDVMQRAGSGYRPAARPQLGREDVLKAYDMNPTGGEAVATNNANN